MNNSLRGETITLVWSIIKQTGVPLEIIESKAVEVYADQILNLIASKMPEYHSRKKLHKLYGEMQITQEEYFRELAVTDILEQVKSILKEGVGQ